MTRAEERRRETEREARRFIREEGAAAARRKAEWEMEQSVYRVDYPFGRIALYAAVLDLLDEPSTGGSER